MHLTDTLNAGGTERVAVNIANCLPRERFQTHLCTTRQEGTLADVVSRDVGRLSLNRRKLLDARAVQRLRLYISQNDIQIVHAHGTSLFMAAAAAALRPDTAVVWHDHFGMYSIENRPTWLYWLAARRIAAVIAVNQSLAQWSRSRLNVPKDRVWYVPNFTCESGVKGDVPELPGAAGSRIVCVANLRPQKDHLTLVRAMALVVREIPAAHLLLVGLPSVEAYSNCVQREIDDLGLRGSISLLGFRSDVPAILSACDIGVLSSASEGLPLSLIEYGVAGLPAVATSVGQCAEVLDNGRAGDLVSPAASEELAAALIRLLKSADRRARLGALLQNHVRSFYGERAVIEQICTVYDAVLS